MWGTTGSAPLASMRGARESSWLGLSGPRACITQPIATAHELGVGQGRRTSDDDQS